MAVLRSRFRESLPEVEQKLKLKQPELLPLPEASPECPRVPESTADDQQSQEQEEERQRRGVRDLTILDLPPEIHLLISKQLIYPDALSLKHSNRHFYELVDTGVKLKVAWLMERRKLHLECPNNTRCDLGSDLRFCRGSVALLMQRRREHIECETRPGLGCLVFGTPACIHRRTPRERMRRWLRAQLTVELWWILLAAIPLIFGLVWAVEWSIALGS